MARRKKTKRAQEETLVDIVEVKDQATDFFEENQKLVMGVLAGVGLLIAGWFGLQAILSDP